MTSIAEVWSERSDEQVIEAVVHLREYSPDAQSAILAEMDRRGLAVDPTLGVGRPLPTLGQCYTRGWRQFASFRGRARRRECFTFVGGNIAIFFASLYIGIYFWEWISVGAFGFLLAAQLPQQAVFVRRIHDTGKTGWWILVQLVPVVGWVALLGLLLQHGDPGPNRWGDPV